MMTAAGEVKVLDFGVALALWKQAAYEKEHDGSPRELLQEAVELLEDAIRIDPTELAADNSLGAVERLVAERLSAALAGLE